MLANFVEETCTGTGNVVTMQGATLKKIPVSEAFADAALVYYVIEDADGVVKVAGVGTYAVAGNTITRNDTWSWNGTAYDGSPASNIALSAGTHTIRVTLTKESLDEIISSSNSSISFMKRSSTSTFALTSTLANLPFQTLEDDQSGSDITWASGKFTAVEAGSYTLGGFITIQDVVAQRAQAQLEIFIDGVAAGMVQDDAYIRSSGISSPQWTIKLAEEPFTLTAGQTIEIRIARGPASTSTTTVVVGTRSQLWFKRMAGGTGPQGIQGIPGTALNIGNWARTESAGVLYFAYSGVNKMKLTSAGVLTTVGDQAANETV